MTIVWEAVIVHHGNVQRQLPLAALVIPSSSMPIGPPECPMWVRNFELVNFLSFSVLIFCFSLYGCFPFNCEYVCSTRCVRIVEFLFRTFIGSSPKFSEKVSMSMPVETNQWRSTIGRFRSSVLSLSLCKAVRPYSFLF